MTNTHHKAHLYCATERRKATDLSVTSKDSSTRYNASIAAVVWDELAGQLYKPNPISVKKFQEVKETAVRIACCMKQGEYRNEVIKKVEAVEL